jgi:hypothetical protein
MAASLGGAAGATGSASADLRRFFFAGFFVTSSPAGLAQRSVGTNGQAVASSQIHCAALEQHMPCHTAAGASHRRDSAQPMRRPAGSGSRARRQSRACRSAPLQPQRAPAADRRLAGARRLILQQGTAEVDDLLRPKGCTLTTPMLQSLWGTRPNQGKHGSAPGGGAARAHSTKRRKMGLKARSLSFTVSASTAATACRSTSATPAHHSKGVRDRSHLRICGSARPGGKSTLCGKAAPSGPKVAADVWRTSSAGSSNRKAGSACRIAAPGFWSDSRPAAMSSSCAVERAPVRCAWSQGHDTDCHAKLQQ